MFCVMDDELVEQVEAFLQRTGMNATVFGKRALSDPTFVFDLREGREPRSSTRRRALQFIAEYINEQPS
jgi:homoserine dehydrogenase